MSIKVVTMFGLGTYTIGYSLKKTSIKWKVMGSSVKFVKLTLRLSLSSRELWLIKKSLEESVKTVFP